MKSTFKYTYFVLALLLVLALATPVLADDADLVVDKLNPACSDTTGAPFCTIQAAINAAQPGYEIEVEEGIYREFLIITKSGIELNGDDDPVINGSGLADPGALITIQANYVTIKDFVVTGNIDGIGISIDNSFGALIKKNDIYQNDSTGIAVLGGGNHIIKSNDIEYNGGTGIDVRNGSGHLIKSNDIRANLGDGIFVGNVTNSVIKKNDISQSGGKGIFLSESHNNTLDDNEVDKNSASGIFIDGSDANRIEDNETDRNGRYGVETSTSNSLNNIFIYNECEYNMLGGTNPGGLCWPN